MKLIILTVLVLVKLVSLVSGNIEKTVFKATSQKNMHIETFKAICNMNDITQLVGPYILEKNQIISTSSKNFEPYSNSNSDCNGSTKCQNSNSSLKWYPLNNLEPGTQYEIRVSYAASSPSEWDIKIYSLKDIVETFKVQMGESMAQNLEEYSSAMFACVEMFADGVSSVEKSKRPPVQFNIVLEKLFLGIPFQALKMALACTLAVIICTFYLIPFVAKVLLEIRSEVYNEKKNS